MTGAKWDSMTGEEYFLTQSRVSDSELELIGEALTAWTECNEVKGAKVAKQGER